MIQINGLTKKYSSDNKNVCVALNDVNLVLPDTGLVFILGKSGSGKSTLLNLIGGLDSFDGGDIVCFSNSLKDFSGKDYEAYRSHLVSFVFQDYHLLDELTVWENVTLFSSDVQSEEFFLSHLEAVGISELKNRYPRELSGGQRQRVAIARALAKNPRIVLCDEPTGNLDNATSKQILKILKELSENKLVLVVSHNTGDANTYADRIIELADGRVVSDVSRIKGYKDELLLESGTATIPYHSHLNDADLDKLNTAIRGGQVTELKVNNSGFEKTAIEYMPTKQELSMRRLRRENVRSLFKKFFFARTKGMIATLLLTLLMFSVFAVIQAFIQYDPAGAIRQASKDTNGFLAIERKYNDYPLSIYDDLSVFENENAYYLYNQSTIWTNAPVGSSWDGGTFFSESTNFSELFIYENYGVMLCDEDYLKHVYGKNGEIPLTAGSLDYSYQTGLLITDYFADAIIYHETNNNSFRYTSHESLIGTYVPAGLNSAGYICGIIDTDYEKTYESVFEKYEEIKVSEKEFTQEEIEELVFKSPECIAFVDDVKMHLGVAYSLNPTYIQDFNQDENTLVWSKNLYFSNGINEGLYTNSPNISVYGDLSGVSAESFSNKEIGLPYTLYNKLFGTDFTTENLYDFDLLPEQTITLTRYVDDNPKNSVVYSKSLKIACLTNHFVCLSRDNMLFLKQQDWRPSRVYFKDATDVNAIVDFMEENEYEFISKKQEALRGINSVLNSFKPLFELIEYVTVLLIASYLVVFGVKSIKSSRYQIGVIKALGGNTADISIIFTLNTMIVGIAASLISALASIAVINAANDVLIGSIQAYSKLELDNYEIIRVFPSMLLGDSLVMICISFVSALIPILFLKKIKPVEIIKAKE